ncbi:NAD(P)-dependent oxidoreductase [Pseudomonas aeruginosa]|nr:NAD(P)-dependent oxidoreductase [Pseudomonas aeruginosa]
MGPTKQCGAYGPVLEKANSERIVTEETASAPVGVYECTKTIADELVMSSVENGVFSYSILRPSNVYGSGMPNGSLRQWARLIKAHCFFYVGPPGSVSTYVHVDDVVEALLLCAFEERAKNQIFNISNDCTQESLVEAMAGLQESLHLFALPRSVGENDRLRFSGIKMFPLTSSRIDSLVARTHYSCNKLNHILGYVPSRDITKEISEVILDKEGRR